MISVNIHYVEYKIFLEVSQTLLFEVNGSF